MLCCYVLIWRLLVLGLAQAHRAARGVAVGVYQAVGVMVLVALLQQSEPAVLHLLHEVFVCLVVEHTDRDVFRHGHVARRALALRLRRVGVDALSHLLGGQAILIEHGVVAVEAIHGVAHERLVAILAGQGLEVGAAQHHVGGVFHAGKLLVGVGVGGYLGGQLGDHGARLVERGQGGHRVLCAATAEQHHCHRGHGQDEGFLHGFADGVLGIK